MQGWRRRYKCICFPDISIYS
ncbi:hypothetical protein [uncultured Ruminococcus sp.]